MKSADCHKTVLLKGAAFAAPLRWCGVVLFLDVIRARGRESLILILGIAEASGISAASTVIGDFKLHEVAVGPDSPAGRHGAEGEGDDILDFFSSGCGEDIGVSTEPARHITGSVERTLCLGAVVELNPNLPIGFGCGRNRTVACNKGYGSRGSRSGQSSRGSGQRGSGGNRRQTSAIGSSSIKFSFADTNLASNHLHDCAPGGNYGRRILELRIGRSLIEELNGAFGRGGLHGLVCIFLGQVEVHGRGGCSGVFSDFRSGIFCRHISGHGGSRSHDKVSPDLGRGRFLCKGGDDIREEHCEYHNQREQNAEGGFDGLGGIAICVHGSPY